MKFKSSIVIAFMAGVLGWQVPQTVCAQTVPFDPTGLYTAGRDSIMVYQLGSKKPEYLVHLVTKSSFVRFIASANGDSLIYQPENRPRDGKPYLLLLNDKKKILVDELGIGGKKQAYALKDKNATRCALWTMPPSTAIFFDYSTTDLFSGNTSQLPGKGMLPFAVNSRFVLARKLNTILVNYYDKTIEPDGSAYSVKAGRIGIMFNEQGTLQNMHILQYSPYDSSVVSEVDWEYVYEGGPLKDIVINAGVLGRDSVTHTYVSFDEDGFMIDTLGHKSGLIVFNRQILDFVYDKTSGFPVKAIAKCFPGKYQPTISYHYNNRAQLTKLEFNDPSVTSSKRSIEYVYDNQGVLTTITNVRKKLN